MKCVYTLKTGQHKRQADITLLFQYIFTFLIETQSSFLINTLTVISHLIPLKKLKKAKIRNRHNQLPQQIQDTI